MQAPTQPLLDLGVVCVAGRWRITVRGELDLRSGRDLIGVAGVLAAAHVPAVTIDLGDISFIDTGGWNALRAARAVLEADGTPVDVRADGPVMQRFVHLVELVAAQNRPVPLQERATAG